MAATSATPCRGNLTWCSMYKLYCAARSSGNFGHTHRTLTRRKGNVHRSHNNVVNPFEKKLKRGIHYLCIIYTLYIHYIYYIHDVHDIHDIGYIQDMHDVYTVYTMYTMLVSGIISSTGLATVQNQILNMFIIPFYNLETNLKTPPSR